MLLARKCLDGSVPPYLNNYINLNTSVHTFTTRRCNDIHFPKVNLEVAKRSFHFTGAMEFNGLPRHIKSKKSFIELSRDTKEFFLNYMISCRFTSPFIDILPFRLLVFLLKYFNNRTPFDTSAYYTEEVILYKHYYYYYY